MRRIRGVLVEKLLKVCHSMKSGRNQRIREERMIRLSSFPLRRHSWIWWELPLACNVCICVFVFLVKLIDRWGSGIHITAMCQGTSSAFHMLIVSYASYAHWEHMSVCLCVCVRACYLNWCKLSQVAGLSSISLPFRVNLLFNGGLISCSFIQH